DLADEFSTEKETSFGVSIYRIGLLASGKKTYSKGFLLGL
ncbi:MAG: hypothetical protein AVDCRST_MAG96-3083, partial [uncultured Segetibacter sp.]